MLNFGTGALLAMRNDITGQTPVRFAALQGVDWDLSFTEKELMGRNQLPIFSARGQGKWTGKAKFGIVSAKLFNSLFFGQTLTTGQTAAAVDEPHNVPSSSPYTISPTNQSTFAEDYGVSYNGPLGLQLATVTAAPAASATYEAPPAPSTTGVYTFSSSDAGTAVLINYLYTLTTGEKIALANLQQGTTPTFSGVFRNRDPDTGLYMTLVLNQMTCSKLTMSSKNSDFVIPEMDLTVMDDGTSNLGTLSTGDVS